ncbi:hypothetical protein [Streptosporangium sp. H16]|uniref:hypothetical protein n=1 Tax=Streptosporangium sp. H16 TaxID=3444184 RepID=UPI003F78FF09
MPEAELGWLPTAWISTTTDPQPTGTLTTARDTWFGVPAHFSHGTAEQTKSGPTVT